MRSYHAEYNVLVFWLGLILSLAMIGFSIFSLIRNPPVPPPEYANCPPHEIANAWCIR